MKNLWQRLFRKTDHRGYNDLPQNERLWANTDMVLRPFGDDRGRGHIYLATYNGVTRIWSSKHTYESPIEALFAAESHIQKMYSNMLATTEEVEQDFSFLHQTDREASK